jgi:N-acetylmuramoyl-L-alanine amidase
MPNIPTGKEVWEKTKGFLVTQTKKLNLELDDAVKISSSKFDTQTRTMGWCFSAIFVCTIGITLELNRERSVIREFSREAFEVLTDPQVRERWRRGTIIVTEEDVDIATRTLIGEANGQPLTGKVAVAHVIINRARLGSFGGRGLKDVALAKARVFKRQRWVTVWQFEPWMHKTRRTYLSNISKSSDIYTTHRAIIERCLNGTYEDPTKDIGGATYFLNPNIVVARSGRLPGWASGNSIRIGDHVFFRHADQLVN